MLQYPSDATGRPPGHVRTPDDFMYWFREQWSLRALGDVDIHAVDLFDEDGQATGVVIDRCRHRVLWSGLSLTLAWDVAVGGDGLFVPVSYSFDFRNGYTDELIVRYDMHPGHPTIGDVHVHLDDSEDEPLHSHQVTLFEAYDAVQWHLELRGSLRP